MNIFLHKKKFLLFFLAFFYFSLSGQIDTTIFTQPGEPVNFSFFQYRGFPLGQATIQQPSHGQLFGPTTSIDNSEYLEYTYQPDPEYLGSDEFVFTRLICQFFQSPSCLDTIRVTVQIRQPQVNAEQDVAFAMLNSAPIEIDVLENDFTESGSLSVLNIPMVNNGTVNITEDGKITFQPNAGFEGIANFNYNACNEYGVCDLGTVSVVVNAVNPGGSDTLRIFTSINEEIPIITPADYSLDLSPANGALDMTGPVPSYLPNVDYTGKDYIQFSYGDFSQTVEINVMNYVKNSFLVNDKAYVIPSRTVEIDVFSNDDLDGFPCLERIGQPKYGSVVIDPENPGVLTYRAPAGFIGVDEFEYAAKTSSCEGPTETATVSVFVSNYEPSSSKYFMSTPKMTPLVIGYYVPIQDFTLEVKSKPSRGEVLFLEGAVDTLIYGRRITGNNLMIYLPNNNSDQGKTDEFELTYCLSEGGVSNTNTRTDSRTPTNGLGTSSGNCLFQKDVKVEIQILDIGNGETPFCFGDCIWSGDTNFDGIVNLDDLLPIGLHMGEIGTAREDQGFQEWYGEEPSTWDGDESQESKHIDTDGDGFISASDTSAIREFYNRTHSMTNAKIPNNDYQLYLKGNSRIRPGEMFELEIYIGSEDLPAIDLYGFTFNLPYSPRFFKPETMEIEFLDDSWINYNSPTLNMDHNNKAGLLAAAFTRTNKAAISGFGRVAMMRGVVEDVIIGIKDEDGQIEIDLSEMFDAGAATGSGNTYGFNTNPFTLTIDLTGEEEEEESGEVRSEADGTPLYDSDLKMFPNPVRDRLNFYLNGGRNITRIQIFDLNGRLVKSTGQINDRGTQLSVAELQDGLYVAKIFSADAVISRKVKILRQSVN